METRGRGRAVRSDSHSSRVRTRAQAAAEAAAASEFNNPSTPSGTRPNSTPSSVQVRSGSTRKRTRSSRRTVSPDFSANVETAAVSSRLPKRTRRTSGTSGRSGRSATTRSEPSSKEIARRSLHVTSREQNSSERGRGSRTPRGRTGYRRGTLTRSRMNGRSIDSDGHGEGHGTSHGERPGSTALQGLLRSLGAGLDDMFPIHPAASSSRIRSILNTLRSSDGNQSQLDALTQLCEYLSVGTEESMVSFSVDSFVPPLVKLLSSGTPDIKLLSARAITHLLDALPSSAATVSHIGASEPLCANLLSIEYIDLAEQSLLSLEKLSADFPQPIVRSGGFSAALSYIDFFSTGVQRLAASTVCNLCQSPPPDSLKHVLEVLPIMLNLLDSQDQRIREYMVQGFSRLADNFHDSSDKLELLCSEDHILLSKVLGLVVPASPPALAPTSFSSAIQLLCTFGRGSSILSLKLIRTESLVAKMKERLENSSINVFHTVDFLYLADSLIPEPIGGPVVPTRPRRRRVASGVPRSSSVDMARYELLNTDSEPLERFGEALVGPLMRFFESCADADSRRVALSILTKLFATLSGRALRSLVHSHRPSRNGCSSDVSFCPFLAVLLGENSSPIETYLGLSLVESTLTKLPDIKNDLHREGVLHELVRLAAEIHVPEEPSANARQPTTSNNSVEISIGHTVHSPSNVGIRGSVSALDGSSRSAYNTRGMNGNNLLLRPYMTGSSPSSKSAISPRNVALRSRDILKSHLREVCRGDMGLRNMKSPVLEDLARIRKNLSSASFRQDVSLGVESLNQLVLKLTVVTGISVHEFSRSRIVEALFDFLQAQQWAQGVRASRSLAFVDALNLCSSGKSFSLLMHLLIGGLSAEEKLPLYTIESSGVGSTLNFGLRQLSQPFKLRLKRTSKGDSSDNLKDYSSNVVLIEPLATMASVRDFLWPRVNLGSERRELPNTSAGNSMSGLTSYDESYRMRDEPSRTNNLEDFEHTIESSHGNIPDGDEYYHGVNSGVVPDSAPNNSAVFHTTDADENRLNERNSDEDVSSDSDGGDDLVDEHADLAMNSSQVSLFPPVELDHELLSSISGPTRRNISSASFVHGDSRRDRRSAIVRAFSNGDMASSSLRSCASAFTGSGQVTRRSRSIGRLSSPCGSSSDLQFYMNDRIVSLDVSILSTVVRSRDYSRVGLTTKLWSEVHVLEYSKLPHTRSSSANDVPSIGLPRRSSRLRQSSGYCNTWQTSLAPDSDAICRLFNVAQISDLPANEAKYVALLTFLVKIRERSIVQKYEGALTLNPVIDLGSNSDFFSYKVTSKMKRQLSDPIAVCSGAIPRWVFALARHASFLVPFDTRRILFESTALGTIRALHRLQSRENIAHNNNLPQSRVLRSSRRETETRISRIQRQKVRIHRSRILESACRVMSLYSSHPTILEVEYFDEVGTGLGPTLEFYTLASRSLQDVDLSLWLSKNIRPSSERKPNGSSQRRADIDQISPIVFVEPSGCGLFPSSLPPNETEAEEVLELFSFCGRLTAKALVDGRPVDIRLCQTFCELLFAYVNVLESKNVWESDRRDFDSFFHPVGSCNPAKLFSVMKALDSSEIWAFYCNGRSSLIMLSNVDKQLAASLEKLLELRSSEEQSMISTLTLSFTLPGDDSVELVPNGHSKQVTEDNLDEYVSRVVSYVLLTGIRRQMEYFIAGFSEVLDIRSLTLVRPDELELLMCGPCYESWSVEFLVQSTRCDHGFRHESSAVLILFRVLSEMTSDEQRKFILFVTGSPALPVGGLRNLNPPLTIVKRAPEEGRSPDDCLPTVMTCTNYLKLPDYSAFDIAKERILYAINEGQGSFHLS